MNTALQTGLPGMIHTEELTARAWDLLADRIQRVAEITEEPGYIDNNQEIAIAQIIKHIDACAGALALLTRPHAEWHDETTIRQLEAHP